jgi:hypothetical protein
MRCLLEDGCTKGFGGWRMVNFIAKYCGQQSEMSGGKKFKSPTKKVWTPRTRTIRRV